MPESRQPTEQCCTSLKAVMAGGGIVPCLCALSNTTAMIDAGLTIRHLLTIYTGCDHIRPGDLHFPSSGCAAIVRAPTVATPSPKLSPAWTPLPKLSPVWTPPPPQHIATPATADDQRDMEIAKLESIIGNYHTLVVVTICLFGVAFVVMMAIQVALFKAGWHQNRRQARAEEEAQIPPPADVDPEVPQIPSAAEVEDLEALRQEPQSPARKKRKYENIEPRRSERLALLRGESSSSAS